ncbi:MAG: hypothetical protein AAF485_32445 [Chloroflexota bacterium]
MTNGVHVGAEVHWRSDDGSTIEGEIFCQVGRGLTPVQVQDFRGDIPRWAYDRRDHVSYLVIDSAGKVLWPEVGKLRLGRILEG